MPGTAQISCKSLTILRKKREVIRDFSLLVESECVVLEGPESGTLLEVFAGWRRPRSGSVELSGEIVARLPFEKLPIYWTGSDWLSLCGTIDADITEVLKRSGIRLDKIIRNLDARESQILSTVSALMSGPKIYLLHEPFQGMKEIEAQSLVELLKKRASEGAAIVLGFEHYGWPFSLRKVVV